MIKGVKMTFKKANQYLREGKTKEALKEYQKIENTNPLYDQARFNIALIEQDLDSIISKKGRQLTLDRAVGTSSKLLSSNSKPLVSVVMPVFNVAPYLDASIMSVLNQTYENIELIIVDDASTDNGMNIIKMYEKQDNRIKVISLEFNTLGGAGIPSNIGVDNAKGEYIAYADSDDILDKEAIENFVEAAEEFDAEIVIADFCNFDNEDRIFETAYDKVRWAGLPLETVINPKEYPSLLSLSPVPWRKLYKRDYLENNNIRFPEGDYFFEDNPLHWFVLSKAERVVLIDKEVAYHRMAREGQTMGADSFKLAAHFCHINSITDFFHSSDQPMAKVFWQELIKRALNCQWVVTKVEDEKLKNTFRKRNAQLIENVLERSNLPAEIVNKYTPQALIKMREYSKARQDIDLTIIIPVYNCADLIEDTLKSLTQFQNIKVEVLIIDDGSSDDSLKICKKYSDRLDSFYTFSQNNKGAGVARNALIPLAIGKYTYFLDADDTIDIKNLEEAVVEANKNSNDLLLFKYKIHYFEKNKSTGMFGSDQNIWDKLLVANNNDEKKVLASGLINYPWNRIIATKLLHDENIFFGKTVVHNDVPYHWHSIIASKNIGVFDKAVCSHRKFDEREQITNIKDSRRMMVLEAYRYTHHLISKYEDFDKLLPVWIEFITRLLDWASDRIPVELSKEYDSKRFEIIEHLNSLKQVIQHDVSGSAVSSDVGFYRIIGNSINGLHVEDQSLGSLKHIIDHESSFKGIQKYFVLNRIINNDIKNKLIKYLKSHNLEFLVIDFDIEEFKSIGYDLTTLPSSHYWFEKKSNWHMLICNTAIRRLKNAYLMNNNGSRNFALTHGRKHYQWVMPWDGNCFLSDQCFRELMNTFNKTDSKYVLTPMERVTDNSTINRNSKIINGIEEPQISFRHDAIECFNKEMVYGSQSKVELFKRLGYKGPWDELVYLYPWKRTLNYELSKEAGQYTISSGVFRLHSGNSKAAVDGRTRSHTRARGISDNIDSVEINYIKDNLSKNLFKSDLLNTLNKVKSDSQLSSIHKDVFVSNTIDINKCNTDTRVYVTLYMYSKSLLTEKNVSLYAIKALKLKDVQNLENIYKVKAALNQLLTSLLISLSTGELKQAVQTKVDIIMLLYFYYDKKEQAGYGNNTHIEHMIEVVKIIFKEVFEYDVIKDLKLAKVYK